jgi:hypothetical protein
VSPLGAITVQAAKEGLPFLVAGGHAVIVHGHARNTFDLDLIIRRTDQASWKELVKTNGYSFHREGPTFLQFDPRDDGQALPLDLMLVGEDTFAKLMADAVPAPASAPGAKVVSLRHLLALKCHAIKHGHRGRIVKDADDVIRLTLANKLDLDAPISATCFRSTARWNCMKKCEDSAKQADAAELEFPDWSGMDDCSARISPDAAFELCGQYRSWFSELAEKWRSQRPEKCLIEFVL